MHEQRNHGAKSGRRWLVCCAALLSFGSSAAEAATSVVLRAVEGATCVQGSRVLPEISGSAEEWAQKLRPKVHFVIARDGEVHEAAKVGSSAQVTVALMNPAKGAAFSDAQIVALALLIDELGAVGSGDADALRADWGARGCAKDRRALDAFDWGDFRERLSMLAD